MLNTIWGWFTHGIIRMVILEIYDMVIAGLLFCEVELILNGSSAMFEASVGSSAYGIPSFYERIAAGTESKPT